MIIHTAVITHKLIPKCFDLYLLVLPTPAPYLNLNTRCFFAYTARGLDCEGFFQKLTKRGIAYKYLDTTNNGGTGSGPVFLELYRVHHDG